ncbi:MAG: hypothetical protein IH594_00925, partial [Bacteroidales bacterium]|nr:hypothetical protein [Bacteroidales bacterium]
IDPARAIKTFTEMGYSRSDIVITNSEFKACDALRKAKILITEEAALLTRLDLIEANIEATGVPDVGADIAWKSIHNRKPVIMLNVETDITIGALLNYTARKNNALYTVASGDEPGVCKMMYEQALLMGFEVVTIGKGKNNPINFDATPESCYEEALSKDMNPKILASFQDGTKTMVEMAAVSNSTRLVPDVPGMHGPKVELEDLIKVYTPVDYGGILSGHGRVEYSTGSIAPGVFVIVYSDNPRIQKDMKFITKAEGPYYLHFRPYHLCDLETPQSVAEAVLLNEVTVAAETMYSEVVAVAKRDLKAGEVLKGIGSADFFGRIYTYAAAGKFNALPIGIAEKARLLKDVRKGTVLTKDLVQPVENSIIYQLRKEQDKLIEDGTIHESTCC